MDLSNLLNNVRPAITEMFPLVAVSQDTLDEIRHTTWVSPPRNPDVVSLYAVLKDGKTKLPLMENVSVEVLHTMLENHPSNEGNGDSRSYDESSGSERSESPEGSGGDDEEEPSGVDESTTE